jgi:hypothetical protein
LVLNEGEYLVSRSGSFTPGGRDSDIYWIGGCVGPTVCLDEKAKRKNPFIVPAGNVTPVVQSVGLDIRF